MNAGASVGTLSHDLILRLGQPLAHRRRVADGALTGGLGGLRRHVQRT